MGGASSADSVRVKRVGLALPMRVERHKVLAAEEIGSVVEQLRKACDGFIENPVVGMCLGLFLDRLTGVLKARPSSLQIRSSGP